MFTFFLLLIYVKISEEDFIMVKIMVDLLGADHNENSLFKGIVDAINQFDDLFIYACASSNLKTEEYEFDRNRFFIIDANNSINNYDSPTKAFFLKEDSSLVKGLNFYKNDSSIEGFISCGPTGGVLVSSVLILGRINKIRPALAPLLYAKDHQFCIVDCGANSDTRVQEFPLFAKMGTAFMKVMNVKNPKVYLLSNGIEDSKGSDLVKEAFKVLHDEPKINFCGNIEANKVLNGDADVVVCDGFSGNILLKSIEGSTAALGYDVIMKAKEYNISDDVITKLIDSLRYKYDYNTQGGAILLGVNKLVIKAHGAATYETIYNTIIQAYHLIKRDFIQKIKKSISEI